MKSNRNEHKFYKNIHLVFVCFFVCFFSFVCQHLLIFSHINLCIFSQIYTKRVRYPANAHTHLTTQFCHPTTSSPRSFPARGRGWTQPVTAKSGQSAPYRLWPRCWSRQASSYLGAWLAHTMQIGATTVPVPGHAQAGARRWPRQRRRDTILILLLMGVA